MDARVSELRGAYAGTARKAVTKWAIPMCFRQLDNIASFFWYCSLDILF
jgi:hypothetical protein